MLPVLAPELEPLADTPQDPEWHPEGDVWTHTLLAMDQAAPLIEGLDRPRALAVMLATLAHDLGKPGTTQRVDGRIRSHGPRGGGRAARRLAARALGRSHAARVRRARPGPGPGRQPPEAGPALRRPRAGVRRRHPPPGAEVRARAAVPRGARGLPRPHRRFSAGGDGVVPGARRSSSRWRSARRGRS